MSKTLGAVVNDFGFRLLREVTKPRAPATLISPANIFVAMAIVHGAARGQTQEEIAQALDLRPSEVESAVSALQAALIARPHESHAFAAEMLELHMATSLWYRRNLALVPSFVAANDAVYHAELAGVDFADAALPAVVNDWVARQTRGLVTHVVDSFDPLAALCLATTLFLKGAWADTFQADRTEDGPFYIQVDHPVTMPMMRQGGRFAYVEHDDVQAIRLPLFDENIEVIVMLPGATSSVEALCSSLTAQTWSGLLARMRPRLGTLTLPRFTVECSVEPSLVPYLETLGMRVPFQPLGADFSGLFNLSADDLPVFINQVIHKTRLQVNEDGIVAAAVTVVMFEAAGMALPDPEEPFSMSVNRPFLFAVRHAASGVLLFLGAVHDPS